MDHIDWIRSRDADKTDFSKNFLKNKNCKQKIN